MSQKIDKKSIGSGALVIIIGLYIYLFGPIQFRGAPVNKYTGLIISIFGFSVLLTAILRRREFNKNQAARLICSECEEIYLKKNVIDPICPKCDGKLINLNSENNKRKT
ncbi:MAG: hypothetical protein SWH54_01235 [Thermodesulfobacteriota bacterium]|nr:hypothetical protein [Thermodesulfobacteriota bacterium]